MEKLLLLQCDDTEATERKRMASGVAERNADVVRRGTSDASETAMAVGKFMSLKLYLIVLFAVYHLRGELKKAGGGGVSIHYRPTLFHNKSSYRMAYFKAR